MKTSIKSPHRAAAAALFGALGLFAAAPLAQAQTNAYYTSGNWTAASANWAPTSGGTGAIWVNDGTRIANFTTNGAVNMHGNFTAYAVNFDITSRINNVNVGNKTLTTSLVSVSGSLTATINGNAADRLVLFGDTSLTKTGSGILAFSSFGGLAASNTTLQVDAGTINNSTGAAFTKTFKYTEGITLAGTNGYALTGANTITASLSDGYGGINLTTGGIFTKGGSLDLTLTGITAGSYTLFSGSTTVAGSFTSIMVGGTDITSGTISGFDYTFDDALNVLSVTASAVPEPSTYAMLAGLGMLGFAACRRRRSV